MNIYYLSRKGHTSYDEYDSFVVYHNTEEEAKRVSPNGGDYPEWLSNSYGSWVDSLDNIDIKLIGTGKCDKPGKIIISSFNAG